MSTQKIKTNAAISYFFLGWIFLLARSNPDFQDPFIRHHAKTATKGHVLFLAGYFFYSHFLSRLLAYPIPMVGMTIDRTIELAIFSAMTFFILIGAYRAWKGGHAEHDDTLVLSDGGKTVFRYQGASEADRMILFLSFVPFIGVGVADKYQSQITQVWANTGSLAALLYLAYFCGFWFDSFAMVFLFLYVLLLAFLGIRFFFEDHCVLPSFFGRIPSIESLWRIFRTVPAYLKSVALVSLGRSDALDFSGTLSGLRASDGKFRTSMEEYFTDTALPFPAFLVYFPFVNLLFVPKLFWNRSSKYVLAIGQWIVLTVLSIGIWVAYGFFDAWELMLLFPALLGMASIGHDPFYRLPIIYELYALLNTLTFWLLENTKKAKAAQAKEQSVSFKIQ